MKKVLTVILLLLFSSGCAADSEKKMMHYIIDWRFADDCKIVFLWDWPGKVEVVHSEETGLVLEAPWDDVENYANSLGRKGSNDQMMDMYIDAVLGVSKFDPQLFILRKNSELDEKFYKNSRLIVQLNKLEMLGVQNVSDLTISLPIPKLAFKAQGTSHFQIAQAGDVRGFIEDKADVHFGRITQEAYALTLGGRITIDADNARRIRVISVNDGEATVTGNVAGKFYCRELHPGKIQYGEMKLSYNYPNTCYSFPDAHKVESYARNLKYQLWQPGPHHR